MPQQTQSTHFSVFFPYDELLEVKKCYLLYSRHGRLTGKQKQMTEEQMNHVIRHTEAELATYEE